MTGMARRDCVGTSSPARHESSQKPVSHAGTVANGADRRNRNRFHRPSAFDHHCRAGTSGDHCASRAVDPGARPDTDGRVLASVEHDDIGLGGGDQFQEMTLTQLLEFC